MMLDPVMKRRGSWQRPPTSTTDLIGSFLVKDEPERTLQVGGRLSRTWDSTIAVYIKNPPRRGGFELELCLQYVADDWFRLHFERPPRSFETAILFTEHFLHCCIVGQEVA